MSQTLSYEDLKKILPQRYPMLLLDRAKIESDVLAYGLKSLSMDEEFFQGHFPSKPIMPGVLQTESMYQTALLLCAEKLDPKHENELFLKSLSKVKFRKPVFPGDRLIITAEMTAFEGVEAHFKILTNTEQGLTCQANMVISVRERVKVLHFQTQFDEAAYVHPMVDAIGIQEHIPHRFPFAFLDQVYQMTEDHTICSKIITANEPFMHGYRGQFMTVPSTIICEMFAQTGCVNLLANPINRGRIAYFAAINEFENVSPVYPGDKMIFDMNLPSPETKIGKCSGFAKVDDRIVAKIVLMFAVGEKIDE